MPENPRRGRQARNFTKNVPKILDLKSSSEQIFFRKLSLGAPDSYRVRLYTQIWSYKRRFVNPAGDIESEIQCEIESDDYF